MSELDQTWMTRWIDAVADGSTTMSQRRLSSIERHGGTVSAIAAATKRGVHLAKLTDDKGSILVAASRHPFEPLC